MRHAIVIEKGPTSYGAYVPDLPGCVAVGKTAAEVRKLIAEAPAAERDVRRQEGLRIAAAHCGLFGRQIPYLGRCWSR